MNYDASFLVVELIEKHNNDLATWNFSVKTTFSWTKYLSAVIVTFEIYVNLTLKCEHVSRLKKLLTGEKREIFWICRVLVNSSLLKKLRLAFTFREFSLSCLSFLYSLRLHLWHLLFACFYLNIESTVSRANNKSYC